MAYGKSKDEFLIKEGIIEVGVFATPELVISGASDPLVQAGWTATGDLGYFKQGSLNIGLNDTFAEFLAGTPGKKIRKDLIMRAYSITVQSAQFNKDLFALLMNMDTLSGTYPVGFIGNDAPVKPRVGILITTERVDGTPLYFAQWSAEVTTEDKSIVLSGTEHAAPSATFEAFEHDNFILSPNDKRNYGMISLDLS